MLGVPCVLAAAGFLLVTVHAMTAAHIVGWLFVVLMTYRLLAAALRHAGADTTLRALLLAGLVLRAAGAVAKYVVSQRAYDGSADAFRYGEEAAIVARRMQSHLVLPGDFHFHRRGTDFVTWVVALLYRTFGPHLILATAVFTLAAFAGTCCLLRVGADSFGRRPLRVFAALVLLMPSLCFWASSVGKEAWLAATMGPAILALSRIAKGQLSSRLVAVLATSAALALIVRPHVVLLLACAWLPAGAALGSPPGVTRWSRVRTAALALALVPLSLWMIRWGFSGSLSGSGGAGSGMLDLAADETGLGGSAFTPSPITSPATVAGGVWAVLGRPHLFEADGRLQVLTAVELIVVAVVCVALLRPRRVARRVLHDPVVAFAAVYVAGFVFAFSRIANFGILARQRVQMWPLLFLVVAAGVRADGQPAGAAAPGADEQPGAPVSPEVHSEMEPGVP